LVQEGQKINTKLTKT